MIVDVDKRGIRALKRFRHAFLGLRTRVVPTHSSYVMWLKDYLYPENVVHIWDDKASRSCGMSAMNGGMNPSTQAATVSTLVIAIDRL